MPLGAWLDEHGIDLTQELNQSNFGNIWIRIRSEKDYTVADPRRPEIATELLSNRRLVLYESKTFHIYDDLWTGSIGSKWDPVPTLAAPFSDPDQKYSSRIVQVLVRARYFRLAIRESCGNAVTSERSCAAILARPGFAFLHSAQAETDPWHRPNCRALCLLAVLNSYVFDWMMRLRIRAHVSKTALRNSAWARLSDRAGFLVHNALRLTCNHAGYAPLWREQLGGKWREPGKEPLTWPVLGGEDERWEVRAAIDAVVADAYGLSREQYAHVLSTFSHASYPAAPRLCLAKFDELRGTGREAFTRKYDPYWDIPLNENLPQPVIDLPLPGEPAEPNAQGLWADRDGQLTFLKPGTLFDEQTRRPARTRPPEPPGPPPAAPDNEAAYRRLCTLLTKRGTLTSSDVQTELDLDAAAARLLLRRLVDERMAARTGRGRGTQYQRLDG